MFRSIYTDSQNAHPQQPQQVQMHYPPPSSFGFRTQNVQLNGNGTMQGDQSHPQQVGQQGGLVMRVAQQGAPPPGGPGSTADGQSNSASGGMGMGQEMNLAGVLHYLQSEWRRWERDRNEWEIERAEMRARIALLEGQRRSAENLKVDLLRRVKMLEYALRQERTKTVGTMGGKAPALAPSRLSVLQDEDRASSKDEREGSGSDAGSEEGSSDRPKANGVYPVAMSKSASVTSQKQDNNVWKNLSAVPRDPKSRARSREYLKQCLQEITYLTSPGALNPLPADAPVSADRPPSPSPSASEDANRVDKPTRPTPIELANRPRKILPEQPPPSKFNKSETEESKSSLPNGTPEGESSAASSSAESSTSQPSQPSQASVSNNDAPRPSSFPQRLFEHTDASSPSRPTPLPLPDEPLETVKEEPIEQDDGKQILTAIYRPDSKAAWREELRAANEMAEKAQAEKAIKPADGTDEEQLASLTFTVEEESVKPDDAIERIWTSKKSLKSHLDIVRTVDFARGAQLICASGGDDYTVKVWSLDSQSLLSSKHATVSNTDIEPIITYRGHTGPVTSVVASTARGLIFSASTDATIRIWKIPPLNHDPYAPHDPSFEIQTLEGHTDAIWDLCLWPSRDAGIPGSETSLISASADGSLRHWTKDLSKGNWKLQATLRPDGQPTSLSAYRLSHYHFLVGMSDGKLELWSPKSEDRRMAIICDSGSQINAILMHPTLPLIITGHEDGYIRFHEMKSFDEATTTEVLAHPSAVTSIALSPRSPMFIVTASTDCTLRIWDIVRRQSVQDLHGHRARSDEGVTAVASHPELPVIASAGADGVIRLWGAG